MDKDSRKMKGFSLAAVGPPILIIIGITLVFIIGRNSSTEEYIHSYRAREAFSTLNHLEYAKKTFDSWIDLAVPAATLELGRTGLGADDSHSKDGIAIWTPGGPTDEEAKTKLMGGIKNKINSLQTVQIEGKYALIDYTSDLSGKKDTEIELKIPEPLASATYFDIVGNRPFKVVKDIAKQAIYYAADSVGIINQRIYSSFFKIFTFGRDFLANGNVESEITGALTGSATTASITRDGCAMYAPSACEAGCQDIPEPSYATPQEVFSSSNLVQPFLDRIKSLKKSIGGEFSASMEVDEPSIKIKAGYVQEDVLQQTSACSYTCSYSDTETDYICLPSIDLPVCIDVPIMRDVTKWRTCNGVTKTTTVVFTLLADMYLKYSSQDARSLVPSDTLNAATGLPFNALEFNYMVHACSKVKFWNVDTTYKEDILNCRLEGFTPVE